VAVELADALLRFIAEDQDLFILRLPQNRSRNAGAVERRSADLYGVAASGQNDPIEGNVGTDLARDQIAADNVAFGNLVLLAAGFNDRVHNLRYDTRQPRQRQRARSERPPK
jgi:hypothetical protein